MSLNVSTEAYRRAVMTLQEGGLVAYPTEAVYGIGCDPFNQAAVKKLLELKQRDPKKGLILIAAEWQHVEDLVTGITEEHLKKAFKTWPGPATWVFPKSKKVPQLIHGDYDSVALRITGHIQARALCEQFAGPLVSTSANLQGEAPVKNNIDVYQLFGDHIDYILPGRVGDLDKPTKIRDIMTGKIFRS